MFERFTQDARAIVIGAQQKAHEVDAAQIDSLHMLAALFHTPQGSAGRVLLDLGASPADLTGEVDRIRRRGGISDSDAAALDEFGIDIERIVERVEQAHGLNALAGDLPRSKRTRRKSGHLPFAEDAKQALAQSLREAAGLGDRHIGDEHLLLALAATPGPAADVLARRNIDYLAIRRALQESKAG
jgi:ATP-dependent Clp protease ATP-binding subunit ClpA